MSETWTTWFEQFDKGTPWFDMQDLVDTLNTNRSWLTEAFNNIDINDEWLQKIAEGLKESMPKNIDLKNPNHIYWLQLIARFEGEYSWEFNWEWCDELTSAYIWLYPEKIENIWEEEFINVAKVALLLSPIMLWFLDGKQLQRQLFKEFIISLAKDNLKWIFKKLPIIAVTIIIAKVWFDLWVQFNSYLKENGYIKDEDDSWSIDAIKMSVEDPDIRELERQLRELEELIRELQKQIEELVRKKQSEWADGTEDEEIEELEESRRVLEWRRGELQTEVENKRSKEEAEKSNQNEASKYGIERISRELDCKFEDYNNREIDKWLNKDAWILKWWKEMWITIWEYLTELWLSAEGLVNQWEISSIWQIILKEQKIGIPISISAELLLKYKWIDWLGLLWENVRKKIIEQRLKNIWDIFKEYFWSSMNYYKNKIVEIGANEDMLKKLIKQELYHDILLCTISASPFKLDSELIEFAEENKVDIQFKRVINWLNKMRWKIKKDLRDFTRANYTEQQLSNKQINNIFK